jgi:hypothetical protein
MKFLLVLVGVLAFPLFSQSAQELDSWLSDWDCQGQVLQDVNGRTTDCKFVPSLKIHLLGTQFSVNGKLKCLNSNIQSGLHLNNEFRNGQFFDNQKPIGTGDENNIHITQLLKVGVEFLFDFKMDKSQNRFEYKGSVIGPNDEMIFHRFICVKKSR